MRFRNIPIEVDAVQYRGILTPPIEDFLGPGKNKVWEWAPENGGLRIATLDGVISPQYGDYIVRVSTGNIYIASKLEFESAFELIVKE